MWDASLKRQNNSPSASAAFEAFGCRCPVFLVLAPACTAVRFGLLLSTSSRLTHILYAVFRRIKLYLRHSKHSVADRLSVVGLEVTSAGPKFFTTSAWSSSIALPFVAGGRTSGPMSPS